MSALLQIPVGGKPKSLRSELLPHHNALWHAKRNGIKKMAENKHHGWYVELHLWFMILYIILYQLPVSVDSQAGVLLFGWFLGAAKNTVLALPICEWHVVPQCAMFSALVLTAKLGTVLPWANWWDPQYLGWVATNHEQPFCYTVKSIQGIKCVKV